MLGCYAIWIEMTLKLFICNCQTFINDTIERFTDRLSMKMCTLGLYGNLIYSLIYGNDYGCGCVVFFCYSVNFGCVGLFVYLVIKFKLTKNYFSFFGCYVQVMSIPFAAIKYCLLTIHKLLIHFSDLWCMM